MYCRRLMLALVFTLTVTPVKAELRVGVGMEAGYRYDNLDWNIASNIAGNTTPNILSELSWTSLSISQVRVNGWLGHKDWLLFGDLGFGRVDDGDNQDSDYDFDNRQGEFSRSNNKPNGDMADFSFGLGFMYEMLPKYKIRPHEKRHYWMPMIGYSYHNQDMGMTNGVQTVESYDAVNDLRTPPLGPFDGLDSTYNAEWWGGWIGLSFIEEDISSRSQVALDISYHVARFYAEADWNLRIGPPDGFQHPKSFEHEADSNGFSIKVRGRQNLRKALFFTWSLNYARWWTQPGIDRVFIYDGSIAVTRLNKVNWDSASFNVGLGVGL